MTYTHALFTYAIPGFWLQRENGEKVFSAHGAELTESGRSRAHEFPCNCWKELRPEHLARPGAVH